MRKILLLSNKVPFPPRDGSTIAMASHIRGLLANEAEVTVLALNTVKHRVSELPANTPAGVKWEIIDCDTTPNIPGLLWNTLFSKESYMVSRFNRNDVRQKLESILKQSAFDLVILEGLFMTPYIETINSFNIPVYLRAHNVEHQIWNRQIEQESSSLRKAILSIQNKRLKSFEERMTHAVDGVIAITEVDAEWYRTLLAKDKVYVMPTGIDPSIYPNFESKSPDVFHLGAMDWIPNVDGIEWFAKDVWPEVLKCNAQTSFHLGGRDSEKLNLHDPSRGFFVEGKVEDASKFYEKHGIFVVPLRAGSGMRIKVLEAMAYGKAIVGTSIGIEGIPFENGVHGLIANSESEFADAIAKLLRSPELRAELGQNARRLIHSEFNESQLAKELLNFLNK